VAVARDNDPDAARTVAEFTACLRQVRTRAGNPSLRELEQRARRLHTRLPRSSVSDALTGDTLPRRDLVVAFLRACGVDPMADPRWIRAWTRLADTVSPGGPLSSAGENGEVTGQLARDVRAAGLVRIGTTYLSEVEWKSLFAGVSELDIFMAYGQTWRHLHAPDLARVAAQAGSRIRIFLADPDDEMTVAALAARFAISPGELRDRISATRASYADLRSPGGAVIEIFYWPGDRAFSFFRLDQVAVVGFYSHSKSRAASVPVFVCREGGELYQFVLDELDTIAAASRPA
jgi:helix-turn-helix protein